MLRGVGRPTRSLNAKLLCVFCVQLLPAELLGLGAGDASNRLSREEPIEDIEADVPPGGAPSDEAAIDVVPQRQARAAAGWLELHRISLPPQLYSSTLGASARFTIVSET